MNHEEHNQSQEKNHGRAGHYWHMLLCLAMVGAVFFFAPRGTETAPAQAPTTGRASEFIEQQAEAGGVTVIVQPKQTPEGVAFELVFDTHSVELDFDPKLVILLVDANGKELMPREWGGDSSGGHHRTITVAFDAVLKAPFTLLVRNVGGVPERIFKWEEPL